MAFLPNCQFSLNLVIKFLHFHWNQSLDLQTYSKYSSKFVSYVQRVVAEGAIFSHYSRFFRTFILFSLFYTILIHFLKSLSIFKIFHLILMSDCLKYLFVRTPPFTAKNIFHLNPFTTKLGGTFINALSNMVKHCIGYYPKLQRFLFIGIKAS